MLLSIWEAVKLAIIGGTFGFLVGFFNSARKNKKRILWPSKLKTGWNLGFLYDCMESAMAAFALILMVGPSDWVRVFLVSLIGALNANAVFNALLKRLNQLTANSIDKSMDKVIDDEDEENKDVK